jgi:hypothetical protein
VHNKYIEERHGRIKWKRKTRNALNNRSRRARKQNEGVDGGVKPRGGGCFSPAKDLEVGQGAEPLRQRAGKVVVVELQRSDAG